MHFKETMNTSNLDIYTPWKTKARLNKTIFIWKRAIITGKQPKIVNDWGGGGGGNYVT